MQGLERGGAVLSGPISSLQSELHTNDVLGTYWSTVLQCVVLLHDCTVYMSVSNRGSHPVVCMCSTETVKVKSSTCSP